jgi:hypothetical protein
MRDDCNARSLPKWRIKDFVLFVLAAGCALTVGGNAARATLFYSALGTSAPPTLIAGIYSMTPFGADSWATFGGNVTSVAAPAVVGGNLVFSSALSHRQVGNSTPSKSWDQSGVPTTWGNSYFNDVYFQSAGTNGVFSVTLTMPANTGAFYFYAQPATTTSTLTFSTTVSSTNGTDNVSMTESGASNPNALKGEAVARGYEIYASANTSIGSITITVNKNGFVSTGGFAIGEFGIAQDPPNVETGPIAPEPASLTLLSLSGIGLGAGYVWRRRKEKPVIAV